MDEEEMVKLLESMNEPRYRAKQINDALLQGARSLDDLTTVSALPSSSVLP